MGRTPLLDAAGLGQPSVAKVLLERGASVSIKTGGGITVLHLSAQDDHVAVAQLLVKARADLEAKNKFRYYTPSPGS